MCSPREPQPVKYVFLDVVGFSRGRSTEAQTDIVRVLNATVSKAVENVGLHPEDSGEVIFLPTGDGICIAIVLFRSALDIHMRLATEILSIIAAHNRETTDEMRRFQVRIGLNQNVDNIVEDINGKRNVAGAGINLAQRIMDRADGDQILVGESVFDVLRHRERYMKSFRRFGTEDKHRTPLTVYQYIGSDTQGLNTAVPSCFAKPAKARKALTLYQAYYLAQAVRHRAAMLPIPVMGVGREAACVLLHFLAEDAVRIRETPETSQPILKAHGADYRAERISFEDQLKYYSATDTWVSELAISYITSLLDDVADCFEDLPIQPPLFVTEAGKKRLQEDHPDIWQEVRPG